MDAVAEPYVLVVEDDPTAADALAALVRSRGLGVKVVADGRSALEWLESRPAPQAILLDLCMTGLDGWDVLERLRDDGRLDSLAIVVTSGLASCARLGSLEGARAVLAKPIDSEALGRVLDRLAAA